MAKEKKSQIRNSTAEFLVFTSQSRGNTYYRSTYSR